MEAPVGAARRPPSSMLGVLSLRLDAAYCLGVALVLVAFSGRIGDEIGSAASVVVAAAVLLAAWSLLVWKGAHSRHLVRWLRGVMVVNVAAALVIGAGAMSMASPLFVGLAAAVAVEVAAFAVSQGVALRRRAAWSTAGW